MPRTAADGMEGGEVGLEAGDEHGDHDSVDMAPSPETLRQMEEDELDFQASTLVSREQEQRGSAQSFFGRQSDCSSAAGRSRRSRRWA